MRPCDVRKVAWIVWTAGCGDSNDMHFGVIGDRRGRRDFPGGFKWLPMVVPGGEESAEDAES